MRRFCLFLCGVALLSAAPAYAQNTILPTQFHSWTLKGCTDKPVHFALAKEAGERAFESCEYTSAGKSVVISLAQYRDPTNAYEVYTSRQRAGMMPTKLGQNASFDKGGVLIQEGALVLESAANISRDDLGALVQILDPRSEKGPLPQVGTFLPTEGRLVGSERFAQDAPAMRAALASEGQPEMPNLVNAMGFSKDADEAEAILARYSSPGKGNGVLLLIEYPTPNVAEQRIHHLNEVLPPSARLGEQNVTRKGSLLSIVLAASSPEYAKSLREASNYETQVTWNEPHQTLTDPPLMSTIAKIFVGTFVFMIAAVVLGIAFGGVRIITKRLFPGKVFDRREQIEVLQLGLSGKPIDPTDLY